MADTWTVALRPLPGANPQAALRGLRELLKRLKRSHKLECVRLGVEREGKEAPKE